MATVSQEACPECSALLLDRGSEYECPECPDDRLDYSIGDTLVETYDGARLKITDVVFDRGFVMYTVEEEFDGEITERQYPRDGLEHDGFEVVGDARDSR